MPAAHKTGETACQIHEAMIGLPIEFVNRSAAQSFGVSRLGWASVQECPLMGALLSVRGAAM